tara:strand:+ start:750 stop:1271 length:522 start_codon:yes stop_codon:yes gene_type:complete
MGWLRALRYTKMRVIRLSDTTHNIALGLAIGAGVSFSPLLGTHFIQAGAFAFITRSNFISALIGTFVGNPWTFPFMWWAAISFGSSLFNMLGLPASATLPEHVDWNVMWDIMRHDPIRIFLPWLAGGYILGVASIPIYYVIFYQLVKGAKKARKRVREKSIHRIAKDMTGQKK